MSKYSWYGIEEVEAIKYEGCIDEVNEFIKEYYTYTKDDYKLIGKWIVKRKDGVMLVDDRKFNHAYFKIENGESQ